MDKKIIKTLSSLSLGVSLCLSALFSGGQFPALSAPNALTAIAENNLEQEYALVSPSNYEQYLELLTPTDVAVNDAYIAVADGNVIHVYDKADGVYRSYTHEKYADENRNQITKIQFADNGSLFFSDAIPSLHQLRPKTVTIDETTTSDLVCSSFLLDGEYIYTGSVASGKSSVSQNALNDLRNTTSKPVVNGIESSAVPILAKKENELFFTKAGDVLCRYLENNPDSRDDDEQENLCSFDAGSLDSFVVTDSVLCCTINNNFYVYDYTSIVQSRKLPPTPLFTAQGEFKKLSLFGDYVYAVDGNSIRQYSIQENEFLPDYEISAKSDAPNRLNNATDVLLHENKLITADAGNQRITIRLETGEYQVISTKNEISDATSSNLLGATENTVVICAKSKAYLYDISTGALVQFFDFSGNTLTGVAGVYGKYYFTTSDNNGYYVAQKTQSAWTLSAPATKSGTPTMLTADVYGNLYVARSGSVYKYAETEFLEIPTAQETPLCQIPATTKKIAVDYNGNLYALTNSSVSRYENGTWTETSLAINQTAVYSTTDSTPVSFTFGVEKNETYFLFDKSYILKTNALDLPTVATVKVDGADENVFNAQSSVFSVVQIQENALLVHFDFEKLNGAEHFPYQYFERNTTARTALKIGESSTYYVLAEYDKENREYRTYFVQATACETLSTNEYLTEYDQTLGNEKYGYLTNATNVYKFPYLTSLLTLDTLEKNAKIQIIGEITQLDHDYYHIKYETESGEKTGYIPKAYVLDFDGSTPETQKHVLDEKPANTDVIWRFAYIVCGFLAICILTDYLILRKSPKDDE